MKRQNLITPIYNFSMLLTIAIMIFIVIAIDNVVLQSIAGFFLLFVLFFIVKNGIFLWQNRQNLKRAAGIIGRTSKESRKLLDEYRLTRKSRLNKYVQTRYKNLWIEAKSIKDADNLYASFSDDEKEEYSYTIMQGNHVKTEKF